MRGGFVWFPSTVTKAGAVFSAHSGHDEPDTSTRLSGSPTRSTRPGAVKVKGHRPLSLAWFDGKLGVRRANSNPNPNPNPTPNPNPNPIPNQVSRLQARLQKRGLVRKTAEPKGGAPSSAPAAAAAQGGYVCRQKL